MAMGEGGAVLVCATSIVRLFIERARTFVVAGRGPRCLCRRALGGFHLRFPICYRRLTSALSRREPRSSIITFCHLIKASDVRAVLVAKFGSFTTARRRVGDGHAATKCASVLMRKDLSLKRKNGAPCCSVALEVKGSWPCSFAPPRRAFRSGALRSVTSLRLHSAPLRCLKPLRFVRFVFSLRCAPFRLRFVPSLRAPPLHGPALRTQNSKAAWGRDSPLRVGRNAGTSLRSVLVESSCLCCTNCVVLCRLCAIRASSDLLPKIVGFRYFLSFTQLSHTAAHKVRAPKPDHHQRPCRA